MAVGRRRRADGGQRIPADRRRLAARRRRRSDYELYLVYDLGDVQQTLGFVQQTLLLGGLALLAADRRGRLRRRAASSSGRCSIAAETSEKLAAGSSRCASRSRATTCSRRSPARSTAWPTASSGRSPSSPPSRGCSSASSPTSRTSCAPRSPRSGSRATCSTTSATASRPRPRARPSCCTRRSSASRCCSPTCSRSAGTTPAPSTRDRADQPRAPRRGRHRRGRPLAEQKGTELRLVAPGGYFEAEVDGRRIRRIVQNLLGNAIEHGEGRPIVVYVDSDADAVAHRRARLRRRHDAGRRRRASSTGSGGPTRRASARIGGTGLGLAISLEDATLHGGELEVWSEPGRGSCFRLTLPRAPRRAARASPLDLPPDDPLDLVELGAPE